MLFTCARKSFKISLRMSANRASIRSLSAKVDMTTVKALPSDFLFFLKYCTVFNGLKKAAISLFMFFFHCKEKINET